MIDEELAARVIALLNEAFQRDPEAVAALVNNRVPCNAALAEHPTIQCGGGGTTVGLIGILNGLCGVDASGWGAVAAEYDTETKALVGFQRSTPPNH